MGITIGFDNVYDISFEYTAFVNREAIVNASRTDNLLILELVTQQRVPGFKFVNADTVYSLRPEDGVNSKYWKRALKSLDRFEIQMNTFERYGQGLDLSCLTATEPNRRRHMVREMPSAELAPLADLDDKQYDAAVKSLSSRLHRLFCPRALGVHTRPFHHTIRHGDIQDHRQQKEVCPRKPQIRIQVPPSFCACHEHSVFLEYHGESRGFCCAPSSSSNFQ